MENNNDHKLGLSMLNDVAKQIDSLGWVALTWNMVAGKDSVMSAKEHADLTIKVESLLKDCEIIENKIGSEDKEALAFLNLFKGRLYAVYIPAKGFPVPHFKEHKSQAISSLEKAIELASHDETKGHVRYYMGKIYNI